MATSLVALCCASVARADDGKAEVNVPFAFTVGGSQLPAGHYVITEADDDASVVAIRSADGRQAVFAVTIPESPDETTAPPQLVFERLGGQYMLSQFTLESTTGHRTVLGVPVVRHEVAVTPTR